MALIEKTIIDKIEILESNSIQVRTANVIQKDGLEITRTFHRHVVNPSNDISGEDAKVQAVANAVWTEEIIAGYLQSQNQNQTQDESNA
jgi:predicted regulator of Ras-like GTPase activity (Roadblock/LC7/MglB family)